MAEAHAGRFSGNFSLKTVYTTLAKRYWWNRMYRDVHLHCRSCLTCALRAMVAQYAVKYGTNWDENLLHLLFAYRTKSHESTGESPFFLLYGRDGRIPCESMLSTKQTAYQVDIDDYKSELVFSLTEAWQVA